MSDIVTIKQAEQITGRDRAYWQNGNGKKWTIKDEDGNIWVVLSKFHSHIESLWQNTPALEKPVTAVSKYHSTTEESDFTKKLSSSPMLKD